MQIELKRVRESDWPLQILIDSSILVSYTLIGSWYIFPGWVISVLLTPDVYKVKKSIDAGCFDFTVSSPGEFQHS